MASSAPLASSGSSGSSEGTFEGDNEAARTLSRMRLLRPRPHLYVYVLRFVDLRREVMLRNGGRLRPHYRCLVQPVRCLGKVLMEVKHLYPVQDYELVSIEAIGCRRVDSGLTDLEKEIMNMVVNSLVTNTGGGCVYSMVENFRDHLHRSLNSTGSEFRCHFMGYSTLFAIVNASCPDCVLDEYGGASPASMFQRDLLSVQMYSGRSFTGGKVSADLPFQGDVCSGKWSWSLPFMDWRSPACSLETDDESVSSEEGDDDDSGSVDSKDDSGRSDISLGGASGVSDVGRNWVRN